ncbi:conserved Plasmodium protein, unknown function [Plasmodium vivax]|uniref:Uncharacterized protein n=1 Tax=Plasmodium vivax TaxID=5855 RepID=A0A1G4H337_PLAVI|nr:conserved Plasmodium protein, unknown function [Plasmodium vivax]VUZ98218.1 conserved Plasmodium protein, unknown function [Plasmodium vivax]
MNHLREGKRKCKVNCIDIELEAFIFGCFFYTWNQIFTENVRQKKRGSKRSTSGVSKLSSRVSGRVSSRVSSSRVSGGRVSSSRGRSTQSLSVGQAANAVKRKSNLVAAAKKTCAAKTANVLEVPTGEKDASRKGHEENEDALPQASSASHIGSSLSEDFRRRYKININSLNEELLHFVKLNFCLNDKNFHIFHDLYSFYEHVREEKKDEEVNVHRVFFKADEGCASHNFAASAAKCPFCELARGKDKGPKAVRRQKFIHACTRRVYGEKNLQLVNKCIINIKTFDDSFVHSITIERLFSYISKAKNKNLLFFWFEFLNVLLKVTINKQLMIQIFFFFCVKNLLITSYFSTEQMMGTDEFSSGKTISTKGQEKNLFLSEMLKRYKYESFSSIVLNNNYKLLQNLFDYFFMVCSTRSCKFYDNFFLNVQMINFIYLVQVNFFHYYYIGLCSKFVQWESANRGGASKLVASASNGGSGYTIRLPKQTHLGEDAKGKAAPPFSRLRRKDGEAVTPAATLCSVKKGHKNESAVGAKFRRVTAGGGVSTGGEQLCPMSEFTYPEGVSSPHGGSDAGGIFPGRHYNVGAKRRCKANLSYHNCVRGGAGRQGSISRYVASQMGSSSKVAPPPQQKENRLARNLKIFFNRAHSFLNRYIQSEQLAKQSNIFSFLFDALPSSSLRSNVNDTLEPYILPIFAKHQFIEIHHFVESLKGLYNLKRKKKKGKKKTLRSSEQPNVKYLNDLQGFNYIFHNLKNDYLMLAESLYFEMRGEREREKKNCAKEEKQKNGKMKISNLIQNDKTDMIGNVSIYKFSSKQLTIQHNLFNIYLECSLLNKAFKLLLVDFNFSFSLTSEVIFLYKMYLIELKRKSILFAFEILSMTFHKCFILLKKYLCNPTSFKLLSLVSLDFCNLLFNYPFLRAYLSFCPNEKIKFLRSNIILHENATANCYYNDYFFQKNDVDVPHLLCDDGWDLVGRYGALRGEAPGSIRREEAIPEEVPICVGGETGSARRAYSSRAMYSSQGLHNSQNQFVDSVGRFAPRSVIRGEISPHVRDPGRNEGERGSEFAPYGQRGLRSDSAAPSVRAAFPYDEEPFCRNAPIDLCSSVARGAASSRGGDLHRSVSHRSASHKSISHRSVSHRRISHRSISHRSASHRSASRVSPSRRSNPKGEHRTSSHSSDDSSHAGGSGRRHRFLSQHDQLYMRKVIQSFNFIFNILEKTVTSCEVSLLSCREVRGRPPVERPPVEHPLVERQSGGMPPAGMPPVGMPTAGLPPVELRMGRHENAGNMTNFIKEVVNKLDAYFSENFSRKDIKGHIEELGRKKHNHFLYDSKAMRSVREAHDDSFFSCLEFLFLAYICSNYFSEHVSRSYKDSFKCFNFNNIWPSNQQIKVKILLSLIHLLLHQISIINLNSFFLQILKIILNKFYSHLDYNDLQMLQYIYMSLSNETLFSCFSVCDEIRDVIRGSFGSVREFAYVFHLSRRRDAFSLCRLGCAGDPLGEDRFVTDLLEFLLGRGGERRRQRGERPNVTELLNGERPNGEWPTGEWPNETALWEDALSTEWPHNETIRDDSAVDAWVDRFAVQGEDDPHGGQPKYLFDNFKSEAPFEKNDFVFFKKSEEGGGRSSFLDNVLLQVDKKNTSGRKSPVRGVSTWEGAAEGAAHGAAQGTAQRPSNGTPTKLGTTRRRRTPMRGKPHGGEGSEEEEEEEEKYKQMMHHFKVSKEEYIENNMNRQNEWFIRLKTWRDRQHYYEEVKPEHYEAYTLERDYYLPGESFETNCFILAEEKHQMRVTFHLQKNSCLSECLNLLKTIDLYMECSTSVCNRPLYFIKNLIISCLSVSYSRQLSVVYVHALIRLCLFELRMDNAYTSVCILLEILSHFEQVKSYRNVLGVIFYLCGYSLLHQLNLQSERLQGEGRRRELIKEYHHYANVKREHLASPQGCKMARPTFVKSCNTPDISPLKRRGSHFCNKEEGEDPQAADSDSTNGGERTISSVAMRERANLDRALSERSHRSSNYTPSPLAKEKNTPDGFTSSVEKRKSSCGKGSFSKGGSTKCARKLIPLVKNQIKITDYFSNVKNEKAQEALSDAESAISDSDIHLNSSEKKCVKKRKKNDGLTDHVVEQKERPPKETNFEEEKDQTYDSLEQINKKQFFLLLICFYMKRALHHWETDGDAVGISNGIQQRKRIKDALFFLMSSYKFFYKSSLFLSKHERIGGFKCPLFDFQLFGAYKTFYAFYRGAFLRCCNENVTCALWGGARASRG